MSVQGRLKGRRILITGAASGIGRMCAELFATEGAQLALVDRDTRALEALAATLPAAVCVADVSDEASVNDAVSKGAAAMGGIDGVVNAAGVTASRGLAQTDLTTWARVLAVNLTGTYLVCRAALPWLRVAEEASIVNIASSLALVPALPDPAYMASKGGVISLSRGLAAELGPRVRVNVVAPGAVDTPLLAQTVTPAQLEAMKARYTLGRIGKTEELARAVLFLVSAESSFITGITLAVDGGRSFH
jgi:NAD(P)-dependent dehydrogenase (short-subunit alcohol dehydrogenase family)